MDAPPNLGVLAAFGPEGQGVAADEAAVVRLFRAVEAAHRVEARRGCLAGIESWSRARGPAEAALAEAEAEAEAPIAASPLPIVVGSDPRDEGERVFGDGGLGDWILLAVTDPAGNPRLVVAGYGLHHLPRVGAPPPPPTGPEWIRDRLSAAAYDNNSPVWDDALEAWALAHPEATAAEAEAEDRRLAGVVEAAIEAALAAEMAKLGDAPARLEAARAARRAARAAGYDPDADDAADD